MRSNLREEPVWCEGSVRESWNRPLSSVQLKYGVISALRKKERAVSEIHTANQGGTAEVLRSLSGIRGLFLFHN